MRGEEGGASLQVNYSPYLLLSVLLVLLAVIESEREIKAVSVIFFFLVEHNKQQTTNTVVTL